MRLKGFILVFCLLLLLSSCAKDKAATSSEAVQLSSGEVVSERYEEKELRIAKALIESVSDEEQIVVREFLLERLGKISSETGLWNSFIIDGKVNINNERFYIGDWRSIIEDENGSKVNTSSVTRFIINEGMTKMYEGWYPDQNYFEWDPSRNLLDEPGN